MTSPITPVVLCGGMGSRLWPLSRVEQPKQFQPTQGKGSLTYFQSTLQRHRSDSFGEPMVVTNARQAAIVHRQMDEVQLQGRVIGEPVGRNTGPAVLAAALCAVREDPDAVLLILPSDHVIKGDINRIITAMRPAADDGRIVTFGVLPTYPETGYGYITDGGSYKNYPGLHRVAQFVEKPGYDRAQRLIAAGGAFWASGISLMRADTLIDEFARLDPETHAAVLGAIDAAQITSLGIVLEETSFRHAANEPTERQVFERTPAIALAPLHDVQWDDVGAWNAVYQISDRDADGNVLHGDVIAMDTTNSLIQSETRLVAVIGMHDAIVIDTPDAVLVTHRSHAQDVKQLVERLKAANRREVASHTARDTAWGRIETVASDGGHDMRIMTVQPGASLQVNGTGSGPSLLTVMSGEGRCTIDGAVVVARRGQSVAIDADHALPLTNPTARELKVIHLIFRGEAQAPTVLRDALLGAPPIGAPAPQEVV
ncbi:mannose-1-phosphate guanylyltransferase/mannose-6-phosphate isomerase [Tabrizicola sp.]|uniref:mannose-1-phosphate guanylyltransferase/mannose-6-phosphate isomerase n=1 Tax=Tabrizicola sp. TaxID=2005166 RepID=UPI00286B510F|nr:mannose-1-phosphate guanylyltransferase/mannose-6-phosphate isomerase [Tabrizicola sp.]